MINIFGQAAEGLDEERTITEFLGTLMCIIWRLEMDIKTRGEEGGLCKSLPLSKKSTIEISQLPVFKTGDKLSETF